MKLPIINIDYVIVDADYFVHRAYHAFTDPPRPPLITRTGILSGCFFGFFMLLLRKLNDYNPVSVIVCWGEHKKNLKRLEILPSYKSQRSELPEAFYKQVSDIKLALRYIGMNQKWSRGYEADDVIAMYTHKFAKLGKEIRILSPDKDLLQLVSAHTINVGLASGKVKKDREFTEKDVEEKFGVPPSLIADYLSLVGDNSDGIPGVIGVGTKTASRLLSKYGPIKEWFNKIDTLSETQSLREKLFKSKSIMYRNKLLISLKNINILIEDLIYPASLYQTAQEVFGKYEMKKIQPEQFFPYIDSV